MMSKQRYIWEKFNGSIPKEENGRSYEIHHIDGNHSNNDIKNLKCVTIREHYDIHYKNGDWGACVLIAKRMNFPPDYISKIQLGVKRPGVGGVKKGNIPWSKGRTFKPNISDEGKKRKIEAVKRNSIISDDDAAVIRKMFTDNIEINDDRIGKIQKNGKIFSYRRAFCYNIAKRYNVSVQYIERIIVGKAKIK